MVLLAEGLVVGALAPSVSGSVLLGLVGSYLGGVIAWLFINAGVGVVFAAIGAVALVYTRRRFLEAR
jgi:hypothetical protein